MGGITIYYSPLDNLTGYLVRQRYGSWHEFAKLGTYDPTRGVQVCPPHHPDDIRTLRNWIRENPHRLTKTERRRYRDILPRPPSLWSRLWKWLRR